MDVTFEDMLRKATNMLITEDKQLAKEMGFDVREAGESGSDSE